MNVLAHGAPEVPAFSASTLLTEWRLELLPVLIVGVLGALYLTGARRLRARGDHWSGWRTGSFVGGGLGSVVIATMSGLAAYDTTLFSAHMVQHMILTMVVPVFLSLGAPVTLALRTLPAGSRSTLLSVLHSRVAKVLVNPVFGFAVFVGSPFALYFSGIYPYTLDHAWAHELMHVHFLLAGSVFIWPLMGLDPVPGRVVYPLRLLVLSLALPFHAFLGVAIMGANDGGLIAEEHYDSLGLSWADPVSDQALGGALLWASGDLVSLLFLGVVIAQWTRAEERKAVREDRRLDRLEALAAAEARPPSGS